MTDLVGEHHESPVRFSSQYTPDALGGVPHCIEAEELRLAYPIGVTKILQSSFQDATFGVLVGDPRWTSVKPNGKSLLAYPNIITALP